MGSLRSCSSSSCACTCVDNTYDGHKQGVTLWLHTRVRHLRPVVADALTEQHLPYERRGDLVVVSAESDDAAAAVIVALAQRLNTSEAQQVRVAWVANNATRDDESLAMMTAQDVTTVRARTQQRWFLDLLMSDGLYMAFQPIVSLTQPVVLAHEALVRGQRDGREISGGEIIALATAANVLTQLDARTRTLAVEQFTASALLGMIFINFQPSAVYNPAFCLNTTFAAITRSGMSPDRIVFEIVESEDTTDPAHLERIVTAYRKRGLKIALDDLGSKHSNLERLLQIRPDFVKIDKSICMRVAEDEMARMMISSIVSLAASISCQVIAEGIETAQQRDWLRYLGVGFGQGFLFARPSRQPVVHWAEEPQPTSFALGA